MSKVFLDFLIQDSKHEGQSGKSKEISSYEQLFNNMINPDFASNAKPRGSVETSALDFSKDKLRKFLESSTTSRADHKRIEEEKSPITSLTADENWWESIVAFNTAPSSDSSSRTLQSQADCFSLTKHSLDLSLAELVDVQDGLRDSKASSPQIQPRTPYSSLASSPSSSSSSLSRISSPETATWSLKNLLIREKDQRPLPAPPFTTSSFYSSPSASASSQINPPQQRMEISSAYPRIPQDWRGSMHQSHFSDGQNALPQHGLGLGIPPYESEPSLSPIGSGYVQHPNTPVPESMISLPQSTSQSSISLSLDCLAPQQMDFTHVDPRSIMAPQPTRPSMQGSSWTPDSFLSGQSDINGQLNHLIKSEAQAAWFDSDSISGAQNPNHQQGRAVSHSTNLPRFRLPGMENSQQSTQLSNNASGGVIFMSQFGQGRLVQPDGMAQPNHGRSANPPTASSISKSFPDLLLREGQLDRIVAEQKDHVLQQQNGMGPGYSLAQQAAWSPNSIDFPHRQNLSGSPPMNLPVRNASGDSMSPVPSSSQTTIPGTRPQALSPSNERDPRSPTPSKSPGAQLGHQKKPAGSKNQHRRKSSSGGSGSPKHARDGFVNFTPHDSRKLLTGVAPSGSSKTKARREREAAENKRRISEAAKQAVMEVGGDVRRVDEALNY